MKEQRYSQQRERIYQAVRDSREHPTAQMVYDALRPELPKLSLGTVYRNLQQMASEGRLVQLDGPVARIAALDVPMPYNIAMEHYSIPDVNRICASIRAMMD